MNNKIKREMKESVVVVMAGGESSRFGTNKALVKWKGKTLIEDIIQKALTVTNNVVLSVKNPSDYKWLDLPRIPDEKRGIGPMGGLYSALKALSSQKVLIVACDMPLLDPRLIKFMIDFKAFEPVVIPKASGRLHPLHARYHKSLLPVIEELIEKSAYKMSALLKKVPVRKIDHKDVGKEIDLEACLSNVNTVEDFEKIKGRVDI